MSNINQFLSNFFSVKTIIGLIAAIIAGVIYLIVKNRRLSQLKELVNNVSTKEMSRTVIRLVEDLGFNLEDILKDIDDEKRKVGIVIQAMRNKKEKFHMQIRLVWGGIISLSLIVALLIILNTENFNKNSDINPETIDFSKYNTSDIPFNTGWIFLGYYDEKKTIFILGPFATVI